MVASEAHVQTTPGLRARSTISLKDLRHLAIEATVRAAERVVRRSGVLLCFAAQFRDA